MEILQNNTNDFLCTHTKQWFKFTIQNSFEIIETISKIPTTKNVYLFYVMSSKSVKYPKTWFEYVVKRFLKFTTRLRIGYYR